VHHPGSACHALPLLVMLACKLTLSPPFGTLSYALHFVTDPNERADMRWKHSMRPWLDHLDAHGLGQHPHSRAELPGLHVPVHPHSRAQLAVIHVSVRAQLDSVHHRCTGASHPSQLHHFTHPPTTATTLLPPSQTARRPNPTRTPPAKSIGASSVQCFSHHIRVKLWYREPPLPSPHCSLFTTGPITTV
jgi:hypothetical protein